MDERAGLFMALITVTGPESCDCGQLFGSRFCLRADIKRGTKATDKMGSVTQLQRLLQSSRAAALRGPHGLSKYCFWAGAFHSKPPAVNLTAGIVCQP